MKVKIRRWARWFWCWYRDHRAYPEYTGRRMCYKCRIQRGTWK